MSAEENWKVNISCDDTKRRSPSSHTYSIEYFTIEFDFYIAWKQNIDFECPFCGGHGTVRVNSGGFLFDYEQIRRKVIRQIAISLVGAVLALIASILFFFRPPFLFQIMGLELMNFLGYIFVAAIIVWLWVLCLSIHALRNQEELIYRRISIYRPFEVRLRKDGKHKLLGADYRHWYRRKWWRMPEPCVLNGAGVAQKRY